MASIDKLPEDLWDEIGSTLVENRISLCKVLFTEEDIVPIAAACLCAGGPVFTFLGRKLYLLASPHLNKETHLGDKCTISDLKEVLTEWKLPASGTKPQLIKRIFEETHPVSIRCPASLACRNNVMAARNEPRIVSKQVFKQFNVSVYGSDKLSSVTMMDEIKGKMVTTYLVKEVRALARRKFGSLENMIESKAQTVESQAAKNEKNKMENALSLSNVSQILTSRGMTDNDIGIGTRHIWFHPYMKFYGGTRLEDEVAMINAADKAEEYVFFKVFTNFLPLLDQLRSSFVYRTSKSKYKQEIELEEKAYVLAMESLVRRAKVANKTIDQIMHNLPRIVHAMARKVWDRITTV